MSSDQDRAAGDAVGSLDVTLLVNGSPRRLRLEPCVTLLDALREYAGLTGSKKGRDHGQCGACTVLIDGRRINSVVREFFLPEGSFEVTNYYLSVGTTEEAFRAAGLRVFLAHPPVAFIDCAK